MSPERAIRGSFSGRGRGAYYKSRYGNKASKRELSAGNSAHMRNEYASRQQELFSLLDSLDNKQYGQYKQLTGKQFKFNEFLLVVDSVQSDAYAPPSRIRVQVDQKLAQFPASCYSTKVRSIASVHYLSQLAHKVLAKLNSSHGGSGGWHSAKGGTIAIDCPGQEVLERTSAAISNSMVEMRLTAALPAVGRTIIASAAEHMFLEVLPRMVEQVLLYNSVDSQKMHDLICSVEDQESLRQQLARKGLVAFIGNGSVLPRASGVSNLPLVSDDVVLFQSPSEMQVSFELPNQGVVSGMGIRQGVTLICGGGFNGKSTLLQAIERGVYNHVPGDGRELVVTDGAATKIKAEEGRFICKTNIRPFINNLPLGKDASAFSTSNASGSTSMAASIQEAIEINATALLFDEDTCATNFLVRDGRMQRLVSQESEPITPLISRVRELWETKGISSILVIGGCGDYLDVADTVISMHEYAPSDVTTKAKDIAKSMPVSIEDPQTEIGPTINRFVSVPKELTAHKSPKTKGFSIVFSPSSKLPGSFANATPKTNAETEEAKGEPEDSPELDLTALDQLVSVSQTRTIASIIHWMSQRSRRGTMRDLLSEISATELDSLHSGHGVVGNLARPRSVEIALAINRLRYAQIQS
ncbi:hypothetical protein IWW36_002734 [Coemansia brasiliensis]|uniref:ATPase n=1 Tax=Coemansia brasiliensis TaxID=2650707 RepID=A0A9W8I6L2_9FUNG|nr:hypothetical protein IWW36_002734 [Coemansia brasiliensis]